MANTTRTPKPQPVEPETVDEATEPVEPVVVEPELEQGAEPPIPVSSFIENASHAVPVAGLLADQPELRDALLPRSEWDALLDAYSKSERP